MESESFISVMYGLLVDAKDTDREAPNWWLELGNGKILRRDTEHEPLYVEPDIATGGYDPFRIIYFDCRNPDSSDPDSSQRDRLEVVVGYLLDQGGSSECTGPLLELLNKAVSKKRELTERLSGLLGMDLSENRMNLYVVESS